jgi:hypothetical protein
MLLLLCWQGRCWMASCRTCSAVQYSAPAQPCPRMLPGYRCEPQLAQNSAPVTVLE